MRELDPPVTIRFTARQWDCVDHQLRGGTTPEVLEAGGHGDTGGPWAFMDLSGSNWRMSQGGATVVVRTNIDQAVLVDAIQASPNWVSLEECYAGNWDERAAAAYQRVADNARQKVEQALGIRILDFEAVEK